MWRQQSIHARGESEWLQAALARVGSDILLRRRVEALLSEAARNEPLLRQAFVTPQSIHYHAEGPWLEDHLRLMLTAFFAIVDEHLHIIDIEEFRRLRGYEGEIDELEETLKENAALFEVFILCHDAAKWAGLSFSAMPGSRGEALGFVLAPSVHWEDSGAVERAKLRQRYLDLFADFVDMHGAARAQAGFALAYGIETHYPGHDRAIYTSVYRDLLRRESARRSLPPRDVDFLTDLIVHHLEPLSDFVARRPAAVRRYVAIAEGRGWDADDFIDLLQAAVFLDVVCGTRGSNRGHDPSVLVNFFQSEHDYAPWRCAAKQAQREEEHRQAARRRLREVGLDGDSLQGLLRLPPGREFGRLLHAIQDAVVNRRPLPPSPVEVARELARRAARFHL